MSLISNRSGEIYECKDITTGFYEWEKNFYFKNELTLDKILAFLSSFYNRIIIAWEN